MSNFLARIFGSRNQRVIKRLEEEAATAGAPRCKFTTVEDMLESLARERARV